MNEVEKNEIKRLSDRLDLIRHQMADEIQAVAQAFNFVLFDFFHDK